MPLGTLPYGPKLKSKVVDGAGTGWVITFDVVDADGSVKFPDRTVNVGMQQEISEIEAQIDTQVRQVQASDSGTVGAFLDSCIATYPRKRWTSGDPAYVPSVLSLNTAIRTWANMPAALTELPGMRAQLDLTLASQARLTGNVQVAGFAGSSIGLQYSTDGGTTWTYLNGGTGPSISLTSTGSVSSGWVNIAAAAKADVLIRVGGVGGNGVADPQLGLVILQVR